MMLYFLQTFNSLLFKKRKNVLTAKKFRATGEDKKQLFRFSVAGNFRSGCSAPGGCLVPSGAYFKPGESNSNDNTMTHLTEYKHFNKQVSPQYPHL